MIALLTGQLAYKSINHIVIDVGGVGYRLIVPLSTFYALPDDGMVRLHVHTHVKEDAIQLFGFQTPEEKGMFSLLIGVTGVGPKLAVNILSNIPAGELHSALAEGDSKRLSAVPGIGPKTADRLVLELKDKARREAQAAPAAAPAGHPPKTDDPFADALSALVNLGYKENLARKALQAVEVPPEGTLEDLLKGALKILVK